MSPAAVGSPEEGASGRVFEEMSAEMGLKHAEELRLRHVLEVALKAGPVPAVMAPVVVAATEGPTAVAAGGMKRAGLALADLEEELMRVCKSIKRPAPSPTEAAVGPCPSPALMAATAA
jgi:hypothetical protein